ncbi:hypothetical protein F4861DRAFT_551496 [Xylaria intraflava]|nr:hypothetical protein F4861DRAFT_551496 [Xylaria intraflava]
MIQYLLTAFPSECNAKLLLRECTRPSLYTLMVNTRPDSKSTCEELMSPYSLATKLPGPNTHPVIVARLMLLFVITLQSLSRGDLVDISEPLGALMRRLITAATTWVTTLDEVHDTVDGLGNLYDFRGCLSINCGNFRRAWLVYRRAMMTAAKLMGLQRSRITPLKWIDSTLEIKPDILWFRIVYTDRHLSPMLAIARCTPRHIRCRYGIPNCFTTRTTTWCIRTTTQRHRIKHLERNEDPFAAGEIAITQAIDLELTRAS